MENTVELIGHYGGDTTHALSAWTSTHRELTPEKELRIPALLKMLASAEPKHKTPFEKSLLHFLVTCDIATHIHIIKHRIGVSVNGESARYKELKDDKAYVPPDWSEEEQRLLEYHTSQCFNAYHAALKRLEPVLGRKRAKESARFYLPYANQITQDVSFNFSSFQHFLGLRNHPDAQYEIRDIAEKMLTAVREIPGAPFKHTLEAFGYGNPA